MHLFHPALVHLTVAFLVAGGFVEAYGIARRRAIGSKPPKAGINGP